MYHFNTPGTVQLLHYTIMFICQTGEGSVRAPIVIDDAEEVNADAKTGIYSIAEKISVYLLSNLCSHCCVLLT